MSKKENNAAVKVVKKPEVKQEEKVLQDEQVLVAKDFSKDTEEELHNEPVTKEEVIEQATPYRHETEVSSKPVSNEELVLDAKKDNEVKVDAKVEETPKSHVNAYARMFGYEMTGQNY